MLNSIPRYNLKKGLEETINFTKKYRDRIQVAVFAGGTGSGKSEITKYIALHTPNSLLISIDDYFGYPIIKPYGVKDYDDPVCYNLPRVKQDLLTLREKGEIEKPTYDKKTQKHGCKVVKIKDNGLIILEGLHTLNEILIEEVDFGVFVDAGSEVRLKRRLERDVSAIRISEEKIIEIWRIAELIYYQEIAPTQKHANFIIDNNEPSEMLKLLNLQDTARQV